MKSDPRQAPRNLLVTGVRGASQVLCSEIESLRLPARISGRSAVLSRGTLGDAMRLNLALRTAHRVLMRLFQGQSEDGLALYRELVRFPWENWIPVDGRFCVTTDVMTPSIRDSRYAAYKVKDAVADRMVQVLGRRPDSGPERSAAVVIHLHWHGSRFSVFLDTSGEPLSRRGYRLQGMEAPLQETLAAALAMASGWMPDRPFVNPMCGSGTLAIEAALLSTRTAPGLLRDTFGFCHFRGFDPDVWQDLRRRARHEVRPARAPILASDIRAAAVEAAMANAERAGVRDAISWDVCDFANAPLPETPGVIVFNPEYGRRLGEETALAETYRRLAVMIRRTAVRHRVALIHGDGNHARVLDGGAAVSEWHNGPLRCCFRIWGPDPGQNRGRTEKRADSSTAAGFRPPGGGQTSAKDRARAARFRSNPGSPDRSA